MSQSDNTIDLRSGIQSVDTALRVLEALIALGRPAMLGAIATEAAIAPNQLHRYLVTFVRSGLAVQLDSGAYDLGPTLRRYGIAAIQRMDPYEIVSERVRALRDETDLTVFLAVWADARATILRWDAGSHHVPITFRLGSTLPLTHSATGRLFLALLPVSMTAHAVRDESPDLRDLAGQLETIRAQQLSWSSSEILPGVDAYAVPVRDHQGDVFAAMTMLIPRPQVSEPETYVALLREAAAATSQALGYTPNHPSGGQP
jgi:DNA-binding IclR family transcriptional regulator